MIAGFYGKLPARGDFVRLGLPREFTEAWDAWLSPAIAGSRISMGEDWLPAFLEAPVWRFMLASGLCGGQAALGLMLPSVDRAGRYFPLTFAALFGDGAPVSDSAWLDGAEAAGRAALEDDAAPEQLGAMLGLPAAITLPAEIGAMQGIWWTDGSPRVAATRFTLSGMPDACVYATMLGARRAGDASAAATAAEPTKPQAGVPATPTGEHPWEPPS